MTMRFAALHESVPGAQSVSAAGSRLRLLTNAVRTSFARHELAEASFLNCRHFSGTCSLSCALGSFGKPACDAR
jgi:hypothetical protein